MSLQHRLLHVLRQAGADAVAVVLERVQPFGFEEDLVRVLVGEPHDLVLDRRAVARPATADLPASTSGRGARFARMRSWTAGVVSVMWQSICGTVIAVGAEAERPRRRSSPGCSSHFVKSMVRPLSRQGCRS